MPAPLEKLLHTLANRMQAASAAAAMLHLAGTVRDEPAAGALQKLMDELQEAARIVQTMAGEHERWQARKKAAS